MPLTAGIYYCVSRGDPGGQYPPIFLLHGAGASHLCWPAELRRLPGYTVYALDLPGHGRSLGSGQHMIESYAEITVNFLSRLGIYRAIFIGHCMGGAIALQTASLFPDQVFALGLISSGAVMNVPPDIIENLINVSMLPTALEWLRSNLFAAATPENIVLATMRMFDQARPGVLYGDWQACSRFDLRHSVDKISVPVWLAAGAEDRIVPISCANFLARRLKNAELWVFPEAAHMVMIEKPQPCVRSLSKFLADLAMRT